MQRAVNMARRIIDIYYNTVKGALTDSGDNIINRDEYPHLAYREQVLARVRLRGYDSTAATAYQAFGANEVVNAAVDTVFQAGEMAFTANADINYAGDWTDADKTKGKLAIRLNCTAATFLSRLGANEEQQAHFEIQTGASGTTTPQSIFRFPVFVRNTVYTEDLV